MRQPRFVCLLLLTLFAHVRRMGSQVNAAAAQGAEPYNLSVSVHEVSLTFHAADIHGLPVNDLKLEELGLLDNGKRPRRVIAFQLLQDFPIRAGIVIDTSASMRERLTGNRAISIQYAQRLFRRQTDRAFVMEFGHLSKVVQAWTSDPNTLTAGVLKVTAGGEGRLGGTAIFDNLYAACRYQFGKIDHAASGNFILLLSDGEDTASYLSLKDAVDMCQSTNTAIYAFRAETESGFASTGPRTLTELTAETGGHVFHDDGSEAGIYHDLLTIEANLRNQYRLIYKPAELKRDGSFHRVALLPPERVDSIVTRSGYYAPAH